MIKIKQLDNWFDSAQLICTKTDGKTIYDFSNFTFPLKFASKIYNTYILHYKKQKIISNS